MCKPVMKDRFIGRIPKSYVTRTAMGSGILFGERHKICNGQIYSHIETKISDNPIHDLGMAALHQRCTHEVAN
ncbi:hypothetical protein EMIT0324P_20677 [Pseudomonas chlororaphis]